jgi:hypothetical protein
MALQDFGAEGLLAFWNALSSDERAELVSNLEAFHALVSSLKNRGIIETDKNMGVITAVKRDPEVTVLKSLYKKINPPGMKIVEEYRRSKA